jgi:hypothetical protein
MVCDGPLRCIGHDSVTLLASAWAPYPRHEQRTKPGWGFNKLPTTSLGITVQDRDGLERQGMQRGRHAQSSRAVSTDGTCCPPKGDRSFAPHSRQTTQFAMRCRASHAGSRRHASSCSGVTNDGLAALAEVAPLSCASALRGKHGSPSLAFFCCFCFALAVRFLAATLESDAALPTQPSD